jgi:hypothetical protein
MWKLLNTKAGLNQNKIKSITIHKSFSADIIHSCPLWLLGEQIYILQSCWDYNTNPCNLIREW